MKADIAIITIREDEFRAVFNRLKEYQLEPFKGLSKRTYAVFSVPTRINKDCAVALVRCSEQGNDVSQLVASDMMRDMDPQLLLVVGIAGGLPHNEFTLGDVVVSSRIHNFNRNAQKQHEITFDVSGGIHPLVTDITATSLLTYESRLGGWNEDKSIGMARPLVDLSWVKSHLYGDVKWRDDVLKSFNSHFGESTGQTRFPLFKTGSIASSNSLIKVTDIPTRWQKIVRSVLAVEMESAGVFQAAQQIDQQYPVMAIRGISDIIGLERDELWTPYACQSAGAFTCAFIKAGIVKPRDSSTTTDKEKNSSSATQGSNKSTPLDLFISYSTDDEKFKNDLEMHLIMLKRTDVIRPWYSQEMGAGVEWKKEISDLIDGSQIILLLISPSFLKSDYLYEQELKHAMDRHKSGKARVIPIVVRTSDISDTPFENLQTLPRNHQPVDKWSNRDEAWNKIVQEIRGVCNDLRSK